MLPTALIGGLNEMQKWVWIGFWDIRPHKVELRQSKKKKKDSRISKLSFKSWYPSLFPYSSDGKESACNARDPGSIPGSGKSPGEGNGNPLHYSCLENPKDKGAWGATVHGSQRVRHDWVTNTQTSNTRQVTINHPILQLPHLTTPTFF